MDLNYTFTAIPRDDISARASKINRVLPDLNEVRRMCRGEIALGDLRPFIDWANGKSDEKFFEFNFVVVLKRRHEHLGFALISHPDKTVLNVDMLCAQQMGSKVMKAVFVLAGFLNRGVGYQVKKITLQAVPNVYGFYRTMGFKSNSSLDELWDEMIAENKGKSLNFSEEYLQQQLARFKDVDSKKSNNQSAQHKILRSLFLMKNKEQSLLATMRELLKSYENLPEIYRAIKEALEKLPRGEYETNNVSMEIVLTDDMMEVPEDYTRILDLKPHYDPDSDNNCAPTPTRYRTLPGPGCPAQAQILGKKCCTSHPDPSAETPNPPGHPDTLRFLSALRDVYASAEFPQNIPVDLQSTLAWINEYYINPLPNIYPSIVVPSNSTWLPIVLKFAMMTRCKKPSRSTPTPGCEIFTVKAPT